MKALRRSLTGAALLALIAGSVLVYREYFELRKLREVEAGVLYRSALMQSEWSQRRVLERTGARTVVVLRTPAELQAGDWYERETRIAGEMGVRVETIPLDYDTPPTPDQVAWFLEIVDDPARRPVLCHCEMGAIRTGMMAAAFRMERQGWSPADAWREFREIAGQRGDHPDRSAVREFILRYRPRSPLSP